MQEVVAVKEDVAKQKDRATQKTVRIPENDAFIKGRVCDAVTIKPATGVKPFAKQPVAVCSKEAVTSSIIKEKIRELIAVAHKPPLPDMATVQHLLPRNVAEARWLYQLAVKVLASADVDRDEASAWELKHAIVNLGKALETSIKQQVARDSGKRQKSRNIGTRRPPRPSMTAELRDAAKAVAINISVTINVENGATLSIDDLLTRFTNNSVIKKNMKKSSAPSPCPDQGGSDNPKKPPLHNHFILRRDIYDCPYGFPPDRKSLKYIPTGKVYAFSGAITINLVNRLTGGMLNDDWKVPISCYEINHLRSTSKEFLRDCVVREKYTGRPNGNRKWSGYARLKGKTDSK